MANVRRTVGVYDRPEKRVSWRAGLLAAAVAIAAIGVAAAAYFY